MGKEGLENRSTRDLFGPEGFLPESRGIKKFFRVASNIGYVEERVRNQGLSILDIWTDKDMGTFYVVYEDGQTFGEAMSVFSQDGENQGVWVSAQELDRFQVLIGVEERAVE